MKSQVPKEDKDQEEEDPFNEANEKVICVTVYESICICITSA